MRISEEMSHWAAGSIFAKDARAGYVVISLAALCLGILLTVLCFRLKRRAVHPKKHDEPNKMLQNH
jgi:hypothetical protein